jgi:hypothetical protein
MIRIERNRALSLVNRSIASFEKASPDRGKGRGNETDKVGGEGEIGVDWVGGAMGVRGLGFGRGGR